MARWQKPARIVVAALGIGCAIVVYAAIGERQVPVPLARPSRLDPRAILESAGAAFQQFKEARQDYEVQAERQLTYEDGSTTFFGVTMTIRNRNGRDVTVSGREARSQANDSVREITGDVRLATSDGLTLLADRATFEQTDSVVRVPGVVSFQKGQMAGTGSDMVYNQVTDVLSLGKDAQVGITEAVTQRTTEFSADTATLARGEQYLSLQGNVRAVRGEEVLQGNFATARLSENAERVTAIELRGNARVTGGAAVDAMSAREIDIDYAPTGDTVERIVLRGGSTIAMAAGENSAGRRFTGDTFDMKFAPPAVLTGLVGRGGVRADLPSGPQATTRTIRAQSIDATGEAGKGLTSATFTGNVEYTEPGVRGVSPRSAHSNSLQIALTGDALTTAMFVGRVRFSDGALDASGGQATYEPSSGTLELAAGPGGEGPKVGDQQIQLEAESIDVVLDGPVMMADGNVRTVLLARPPGGRGAAGGAPNAGRLPGLLQQGVAVNVSAASLDYRGGAGRAVYSGNAMLWQGETAVRADTILLDKARGDLVASGNARSNIVLDTGASVGRAPEIRYDDSARTMTYGPLPVPPATTPPAGAPAAATPPAAAPAQPAAAPAGRAASAGGAQGPGAAAASAAAQAATAPTSQVSGPQGELRGRQVQLFLSRETMRAERLEARTNVTIRLDDRVASGDHLAYDADAERYVMTGRATEPVRIVEVCRTTTGRTVTFFKSSDRIIVDGNEEVRTESSRDGAPCPQTAP